MAKSAEALDYAYQTVLLWTEVVTAAGATAEETEFARQAAMAQFAPHVTA